MCERRVDREVELSLQLTSGLSTLSNVPLGNESDDAFSVEAVFPSTFQDVKGNDEYPMITAMLTAELMSA